MKLITLLLIILIYLRSLIESQPILLRRSNHPALTRNRAMN